MEGREGLLWDEGSLVELFHLGAEEDPVFPVGQIINRIHDQIFVVQRTEQSVRGKIYVAKDDDSRLLATRRLPPRWSLKA